MKKLKFNPVIIIIMLVLLVIYLGRKETEISTAEQLTEYFSKPAVNKEIKLSSGVYELSPINIIDSSCGNCEDPDQEVSATAGLIITGKNITISGPEDGSAEIITNSGYGIFLLNCSNIVLENLTITGGIRDSSVNATDAAIVVKDSYAIIRNNVIENNIGDSTIINNTVVGIMGICGRENSKMEIYHNKILNNSWDGIALYRGSEAIIRENIIDGVEGAGRRAGGGRGVAIGVTWNATAEITGNLVRNYWKGIGLFVDAKAAVKENFVEDCLTWGISLWDAGKGKPQGFIEDNIIYNTGAMGATITSSTESEPGYFKNNIIVKTGQDPRYDAEDYYGFQCALAEHSIPDSFLIEENVFYNNRRASEDLPDHDLSLLDFQNELEKRKEKIFQMPLKKESSFYRQFFLK
ncbi:right-handed parallel beta-helix repeat-containing protein [Candidatus Cloacimonadota bacterium]